MENSQKKLAIGLQVPMETPVELQNFPNCVIPAKAGIQRNGLDTLRLDSHLRGNGGVRPDQFGTPSYAICNNCNDYNATILNSP